MVGRSVSKFAIAIVLLVLGGVLFAPFRTVLVPEWKVRVVDETGKPYIGQKVRQFCNNYTLDVNLCIDQSAAQFTDEDGYLVFPERNYSLSMAYTAFATLKQSVLKYIAHGSMGTSVYLDSSGPAGYATLEYTSEMTAPPSIFLLRSENVSH